MKELVGDLPDDNVEIFYKNSSLNSGLKLNKLKEREDKEGEGFFMRFFQFIINPTKWLGPGYLFSGGGGCKVKKTFYNYQCLPWQAPPGGEDCGKCNDLEGGKKCSEYRCRSLGQACEYLNKGSGEEICSWIKKDDSVAPEIELWEEVLVGGSYVSEGCDSELGCFELLGEERDGCISPYTSYEIGIFASEPAQCKVDINHTENFEEMDNFFQSNSYLVEHVNNISFISPGHIWEALGIEITNVYEFYIRCRDKNGNTNEDELKISLCVDDGKDENIPRVVRASPVNNGFTQFGLEEIEAGIYMNEPSECKWDFKDKAYKLMDNEMDCAVEIDDIEADFTYLCSDVFDLTGNTTYYVRCKDQPWASDERNVMNRSYVYRLNPSESELEIVRMSPESEIKVSNNPAVITLQIETSGGVVGGKAVCAYFSGGVWERFFETGEKFHKQEEYIVNTGRNKIPVRCEDAGGNVAEKEMNFRVVHDTGAPSVARIYVQGGNIKFITTEDADCRYSTTSCKFDFAEGNSAGSGLTHNLPLTQDTYFIKCKDKSGNAPSGCSIVVRGINYV